MGNVGTGEAFTTFQLAAKATGNNSN